jgi:hypothetical protein
MSDITLKEYVDQRFDGQDKAVRAALEAAEKAVSKAEANAREWQKGANEWRGAMTDRERDFLTRREFYAMLATGVAVVGAIIAWR